MNRCGAWLVISKGSSSSRGSISNGAVATILYYDRIHAHGRHEIDVVAELDARRLVAFEIKATAAPTVDDARHLAWLRDHTGDQLLAGIVLHTGPAAFPLGDRLWALPISSLWT